MVEERIYTINLRKEFRKTRRYKKLKVAVRAAREFMQHHLKSENVRMGPYLNKKLHERGRENPPPRIQVKAWQEKDAWNVEWVGAPVEELEEGKDKMKKIPEIKETIKDQKTKQEQLKEEVLTHEKNEKSGKAAKPWPVMHETAFDTQKTGRAAPHKSQRPKIEKEK